MFTLFARRAGPGLVSSAPETASLLAGRSIVAVQSRGVATYAGPVISKAWEDPVKIETVKPFVLATVVPTVVPKVRAENLEAVPKPPSHKRDVHPTVKWGLAKTWDTTSHCAVDKIPFVCAEHALLFRTAIALARAPSKEVREAQKIIAKEMHKLLTGLDEQTFNAMFEVGSTKSESRSKKLIENRREFLSVLDGTSTPIQQQSRVLEAALSPLGMIANAYGSNFCKVSSAQKQGIIIGKLPGFMDGLMPFLEPFHVPYIKAPGGPFEKLKIDAYRQGAPLSAADLLTESHFLECIGTGIDCEVPQLRSVKVVGSERSLDIHDRMNLPHFFDVSGTTGAVMQVAIAMLHMSGRADLVDTPEKVINLGMVLAGCNFYKQGFHNFYEVLPALNWVIHQAMDNQPYVQHTPTQLIDEVSTVITRCMDPSDKTCQQIPKVMEIVDSHARLHFEAYKEHVKDVQQQQQVQVDPGPTLT